MQSNIEETYKVICTQLAMQRNTALDQLAQAQAEISILSEKIKTLSKTSEADDVNAK